MRDHKRLNDYLSVWNLSNPRLLTRTLTSHISRSLDSLSPV